MTGCGQRVWIGYVLVLIASSFQKMRSKDIPHASLGLGKTNCPTIWGPLLQCPAMARSSGTCRAFVMHLVSTKLNNFIANTYVILNEIFREIVAFQHLSSHLSLESTNCHSTFIYTKGEHKILHWPPASTWPGPLQPQGLRLDQPTAPSFSKPSNRISEPPDRGIFLAQVVALVNSSEVFDGFLCWNQQHPKNQRFNKSKFEMKSSFQTHLLRICSKPVHRFFCFKKHQPAVPTDLPAGKRPASPYKEVVDFHRKVPHNAQGHKECHTMARTPL